MLNIRIREFMKLPKNKREDAKGPHNNCMKAKNEKGNPKDNLIWWLYVVLILKITSCHLKSYFCLFYFILFSSF